jgi:hypothetical protein
MDSEHVKNHIAWLKGSIRERGVEQPIRVEFDAGKVYLVDGQCRLEALKQLWDEGLEIYVPAIAAKGDEAEVLAKSMIANGSLPPTKLEFGQAAARLLAYGWTKERVAEYTPPHINGNRAKVVRYVAEAVELHEAPIDVKKAVSGGEVTPALALKVTRENRMQAGEIIKQETEKAKASGKAVAKRPKGAGKVTKARVQAAESEDKLLKQGDRMASLILQDQANWQDTVRAAKAWNTLRGR